MELIAILKGLKKGLVWEDQRGDGNICLERIPRRRIRELFLTVPEVVWRTYPYLVRYRILMNRVAPSPPSR